MGLEGLGMRKTEEKREGENREGGLCGWGGGLGDRRYVQREIGVLCSATIHGYVRILTYN